MSKLMSSLDIYFAQHFLSVSGFYTDKLDGLWGKNSNDAQAAFDVDFAARAKAMGVFDPRSEGIIHTLLPKTQAAARTFLSIAKLPNATFKLLSGTRSYAEQDALYNQVPQVTRARGGQSNHNFGIAWDVGIFVNGVYYTGKNSTEDQAYKDLATLIKGQMSGIEWGGDWKSIVDMPHYQLATGKTVDQVRALFEAGKPYV